MIPKIGSLIQRFEELDSTNTYAANLLLENRPPEGTVVVSAHQSKGRGQASNIWESESGKNLTFSLILYPEFLEPALQFELSKAVSLGIADYLAQHTDEVSIKWPNDIYVGKNKIAGILMEYALKGNQLSSCIIGVGLNVNQSRFYSNAPNPVSLSQITGKTYDLEEKLENLLLFLDSRYRQLKAGDFNSIDQDYINLLYQKDIWALYESNGRKFEGKILGVDEYGLLIIQTREGEMRKFDYKEVAFLT
jgi:BirA family biotin operon repressor/biotin-[acetyl-CoA-carboxylase] ligase